MSHKLLRYQIMRSLFHGGYCFRCRLQHLFFKPQLLEGFFDILLCLILEHPIQVSDTAHVVGEFFPLIHQGTRSFGEETLQQITLSKALRIKVFENLQINF